MEQEPGPFDRTLQTEPTQRRDRVAIAIVALSIALGLLLLLLVLPPVSILDDDDGGGSAAVTTVIMDELPPPPTGYEAVSLLYDFAGQEPLQDRPVTLPLSTTVAEDDELVFFTYRDGQWQELAEAAATPGGVAARGEVPVLPGNMAVFRPVEQAHLVLGSLPPGTQPDPQALTIIATLNPQGFVAASDGTIAGSPALPAVEAGVAVAPTISALAPAGVDALNAILASTDLRAAHAQAIQSFVGENEFAGIDLDYRTIDPSYEEEFVTFVEELSSGLHDQGRTISLTLPLPVRADGDWDTLGYDWEALARQVDVIKVAPELEQDRYHERMEDALAFLVPRVGGGKLLLPVGPLSRERSVDGLRSLTLREALALASTPSVQAEGPVAPEAAVQAVGLNLASEAGAGGLRWDDAARAVAFDYTGLGGQRTVWLSNVFSEAFKLDLARRYELRGVAVEDISRRTSHARIWPAIQRYAETGEVALLKPNGELLQPRWTASAGTLEGDVGASVTWRAPAEAGAYTLTLIVSDGVLRVGQELQLSVEAPPAAAGP